MYIKTLFPRDLDYIITFNNLNKEITFIVNKINNIKVIKIDDINNINKKLTIITNNRDINAKISVSEATFFMNNLIRENKELINNLFIKYDILKCSVESFKDIKLYFNDIFVCLEDFRNMSYGFINNLINDDTNYYTNKVGDFGFLARDSKPIRLKFINLSKSYPNILEYNSTPKYNHDDPRMLSFNYMKKYKYLIDLPGHNYSTKIYSYLHCKRVVFRVKDRKLPFY